MMQGNHIELDAVLSDLPALCYTMVSGMAHAALDSIPEADRATYMDGVRQGVAAACRGDASGLVQIAEAFGIQEPYLTQMRNLAQMVLPPSVEAREQAGA